MADQEQLEILMQGVDRWNEWRKKHPDEKIDLSMTSLRGADFHWADLGGADFRRADLYEANFRHANLSGANLSEAVLHGADFTLADLTQVNLDTSNLATSKFHNTNLERANLSNADISAVNFFSPVLSGTDLTRAIMIGAIFIDVDLSFVKGLDTIRHIGQSTVDIDSILRSKGRIPKEFLLGCGVPENFIAFIPSLTNSIEPFQFHSCFISYSTKDEEFAKCLHSRLRDAKVRVWFAPEDIQGGKKLYDQLEHAIQIHDRLLLVLSEHSIKSNWVETEIRRAIEIEKQQNRRKLFPILLTDYDTLRQWRCFDADSGRDMAIEIREYFIPDFSNWKDHDSFEKGFERLLKDLKDEESKT